MKTYIGFEDIPVYNFYKTAETSDMRWLYKSFRKDRSLDDNLSRNPVLVLLYKDIYDKRIAYTNDIKSGEYYRKINKISNLKTKLYRLETSFDLLVDVPFTSSLFKEFVSYFQDSEGYVYKKDIKNEEDGATYLLWLKQNISSFKTKVKVIESNYSDILSEIKDNKTPEKFDIIREKILLQESLDGINIDIYKCPLIEWCAMVLRVEEKSKYAKQESEKIKQKR